MAELIITGNLTSQDPAVQAPGVLADAPGLSLKGRRKPIVVRVKGKKKKRKYSRSLKGLQKSLRFSSKGGSRLTSAIADGFRKFRKRSDRSSRKRRDGMLKDLLRNSASGLGTTMRKSSKVPSILSKSVKRKDVRRRLRTMSRLMGIFR